MARGPALGVALVGVGAARAADQVSRKTRGTMGAQATPMVRSGRCLAAGRYVVAWRFLEGHETKDAVVLFVVRCPPTTAVVSRDV